MYTGIPHLVAVNCYSSNPYWEKHCFGRKLSNLLLLNNVKAKIFIYLHKIKKKVDKTKIREKVECFYCLVFIKRKILFK